MKYRINLVRELRIQEKLAEAKKLRVYTLTGFSLGILALSVAYLVINIILMQMVIGREEEKLAQIEAQYRRYQATKMIVNKADIELLDQLQNGRIFWTKKLASMAQHLPANFWITKFGFDGVNYDASGYGYISPNQEQLVVVDRYLNALRADSSYSDVFPATYFRSTQRQDDSDRLRVSFDFVSNKKSGM